MRYICYFLVFILIFTISINAKYCVYDCENNVILEEENSNQVQSVASISKVMTAIIVLDHTSLYESVKITSDMIDEEGSSIYLKVGDIYSVESLLHGLMLRSGNDAALALALYVSDYDLNKFINWMNDFAKKIGMIHTEFENPSGLEQPNGNLSTALDMAKLMCYASQYEDLLRIMQTTSYKTYKHDIWTNKNRLLNLNEWVIGGKTGFTKKAGRTLVSIAENPNRISIASFRISNDFKFHDSLYDKWYTNYPMIKLFSKGIYIYNGHSFNVNVDGYVPFKDFDEKYINISTTNKEISISYNNLIWKFPFIDGELR